MASSSRCLPPRAECPDASWPLRHSPQQQGRGLARTGPRDPTILGLDSVQQEVDVFWSLHGAPGNHAGWKEATARKDMRRIWNRYHPH